MSYADLKGKVFFITGAASGQGRATSLALARQGAKLGLLDLNDPQEVITEIEKIGSQAIGFKVNVTDSALFETILWKTTSASPRAVARGVSTTPLCPLAFIFTKKEFLLTELRR